MIRNVLLLASLISLSTFEVFANEGSKLPKGSYPEAPTVIKRKNRAAKPVKCDYYLSKPLASFAYTNEPGDLFYFLVKNKGAANSRPQHTLFRYDLAKFYAEPLASIDLFDQYALVLHGQPAIGFSFILFKESLKSCYEGQAELIHITLAKKKTANKSALKTKGKFSIANGVGRNYLYSFTNERILEFDQENFQTRQILWTMKSGERPVFYDREKGTVFTWEISEKSEKNSLWKYVDFKKRARLKVGKASKLLTDRKGNFGVLDVNGENNYFTIHEVANWSGVKKNQSYEVSFNQKRRVTEMNVDIHFGRKLAVFYPASIGRKDAFNEVIIYDYAQNKTLSMYTPKSGNYVRFLTMSPDGEWLSVEEKNMGSGVTEHIRIYRLKKANWMELDLKV